jgi:hypothetical protein
MADQKPRLAPRGPAAAPPHVDVAALLLQICNAQTPRDFVRIYASYPFQLCLRYMVVSSGDDDLSVWARDWARRMRGGGGAAAGGDHYDDDNERRIAADMFLNQCRKTTLTLVYELLNRWRDGKVTAPEIVQTLSSHRFVNILQFALPLDRAQCIYRMQYSYCQPADGSNESSSSPPPPPGMHWVAESHVAQSVEWQERLAHVGGRPTMNKRLLWLLHDPAFQGLGLSRNATLMRLVETHTLPEPPALLSLAETAATSSETTGEDWTVLEAEDDDGGSPAAV